MDAIKSRNLVSTIHRKKRNRAYTARDGRFNHWQGKLKNIVKQSLNCVIRSNILFGNGQVLASKR